MENVVADKLGRGAYASVYAVSKTEADPPKYAAKVISLKVVKGRICPAQEHMVEREVSVLERVAEAGSESVVRFHESFRECSTVYILMELCEQTLFEMLEGLEDITEATYAPLLRDMLGALAAIHSVGVVHRDIKPDNFMCTGRGASRSVKLCDFGLAKFISAASKLELHGVNGTAPFMAPEMVKGLRYNAKVDTWSLGVIFYLFLFGHFPYMPRVWTCDEMKWAIQSGNPPPRFAPRCYGSPEAGQAGSVAPDAVSPAATRLAVALLERAPPDRASAGAALAHDFVRDGDRRDRARPSLRPMFASAARCGAFGNAGQRGEGGVPSALDIRVAALQVQHGHKSPWSRQTTASSSIFETPADGEDMSMELSSP